MLEDFIVLDVEATGVDPKLNEMIEFAAIRVKNFSIVDQFETLIRPKERLNPIIEALTGIKNEDLETAPAWEEVKEKVAAFIKERPVGGHNVNFDFEYLSAQGLKLPNPRLDSWELSTTILPKLPAYSLSFLAFYLNLDHQPGHRAMADVLSTEDLFKTLFARIQKLPAKIKKELKEHLAKSDWVFKELFTGEVKLPPFSLPPLPSWQSATIEPALLESELTLPPDKKRVLVTLKPEQSELIQALALAYRQKEKVFFLWPEPYPDPKGFLPDAQVLYPAVNYLDEEDFARLLQQGTLSDLEMKLLVKTIIWKETSPAPESPYLTRDEFYFWERWLSGAKGAPSKAYQKALKAALKAPLTIVDPLALRELLLAKALPSGATLFMADPLDFEESAYQQERFLVTAGLLEGFVSRRREFIEKLPVLERSRRDLLFKLIKELSSALTFLLANLGVVYDSFSTAGGTIEIMEHLWGSSEGSRTKLLAEKIAREIREFNEQVRPLPLSGNLQARREEIIERGEAMASFLLSLSQSKDFTFWLKAREGRVFLEALPEKRAYFLLEEAKKQFARIVVATSTVSGSAGESYLKRWLGSFEERFSPPPEPPRVKLLSPQPTPQRGWEERLFELLADKKSTIVIFPSRARLSGFIEEFQEKAEKRGLKLALPETLGLLHQVNAFLQKKEAVLGTTLDFWFRLPKVASDPNPYEDLPLERLVIVSLPFEVPDDPYLFALGKELPEERAHFTELTLPRTLFRLRRIVYPALTNLNLREVAILDPRLWEKDYGRYFVDNLRGLEARL